MIEDGGKTIAESGAIVEYLIDTYGKGRFKPKPGTPEYWKYIEWMHFAEGSAMLPLMMALYTGMLGDAAAMLRPRVDSEIANHLSYMDAAIGGARFFRRRSTHRCGHHAAVCAARRRVRGLSLILACQIPCGDAGARCL